MGKFILCSVWFFFIVLRAQAEQVSGNVTSIKVSGQTPASTETSAKETEPESVPGEASKISGWMKETMNATTYTTRLSNAVTCFQGFIQKIIDVRVKAYDLTLACGLQGAKYCKEQEKVVASSKVITDQFYTCLDGKAKMDQVVAEGAK